ncbi:MAG: hypothetical protein LAN83_14545 [Acidobacteriia bacterium]|nr:hypothetical protein [Terriglobia bacterium]
MQRFIDSHPFIPFLIFPLFWCAILWLIGKFSGWSALAQRFRLTSSFLGQRSSFQSARMRWGANYGSCLTVGADASGLYLAVMFIFRTGHPSLLLPWHEVSVQRRWKMVFFRYVELTLGREEQIPFRISGRLADRIQAAAGANWPVEAVT